MRGGEGDFVVCVGVVRELEHVLGGQERGNDEVLVVPGERELELAEQVDDEGHDLVELRSAHEEHMAVCDAKRAKCEKDSLASSYL